MIRTGSSPRVRGTFMLALLDLRGVSRFIPACAGNIKKLRSMLRGYPPVHPRVCGEHFLQSAILLRRFIPACAGNMWFRPWLRSVHPRVCGEHMLSKQPSRFLFGSSPRVRGTFKALIAWYLPGSRFIPACAGNITSIAWRYNGLRFIPACAGNIFERSYHAIRFIPACAGNIPL